MITQDPKRPQEAVLKRLRELAQEAEFIDSLFAEEEALKSEQDRLFEECPLPQNLTNTWLEVEPALFVFIRKFEFDYAIEVNSAESLIRDLDGRHRQDAITIDPDHLTTIRAIVRTETNRKSISSRRRDAEESMLTELRESGLPYAYRDKWLEVELGLQVKVSYFLDSVHIRRPQSLVQGDAA